MVAVHLLDVLTLPMVEVAELVDHVHLHRLTVVQEDGQKHVNKKQGEKC